MGTPTVVFIEKEQNNKIECSEQEDDSGSILLFWVTQLSYQGAYILSAGYAFILTTAAAAAVATTTTTTQE